MAVLGKIAWAALGIIAYRNRDKISDWLESVSQPRSGESSNNGSFVQRLAEGLASSGSLATLLNQFRRIGAGESVESWIGHGPNLPIEQHHVREVIDPETLHELSQHTGLAEEELVERIARELPDAVDRLTPYGSLPQGSRNQLGAGPTHGKLDQEPAEGGRETIDRQLDRQSNGGSS